VRFKAGTVGLAMLALLVGAPAALASTASLRSDGTVVYQGDPTADSVTFSRYVSGGNAYYFVTDDGGITTGAGCVHPRMGGNSSSDTAMCSVSPGLKRYDITTGDGDDTVRFDSSGATSGGSADLGRGNDRFTGRNSGSSADAVSGGAGDDTIDGGDGDDLLDGGDGHDNLTGGPGNDLLNGGPGDDSLEFAATGAAAGVGAGADDLHGGAGVDLLSYNDHTTAIRLAIDELPGDGGAGENDNVHNDIETVIATTLADTLTGDELGQDLYGHGGNDTIDGRGGDDFLNGGTGEDVIRGGTGDDAVEGSAGGDFLDGGPGRDLIEGDNECTVLPCTGGADQILARDNEEDTINCGVGADRATVDLLDIVATDSQQGCESIDRAALPIPAPGLGAPAPVLAPTMSIRGSHGIRALVLKGMLVEVTCPGACRIRGRLILHKTVVAGGRRTRIAAATTRLRLKTSKAGRRQLKHRTKALMTLVIDVTDSAGTKTTLSKAITFKSRK
jgi:Ca2+-binding RTX toxin-like protein